MSEQIQSRQWSVDDGERVSVVVCTADRPKELKRLISSLSSQTVAPDELIIVDASAAGESREAIRSHGERICARFLHERVSPRLTRQRNIGIRLSRSKLVFFFDDDVVPAPDYIEVIAASLESGASDNIGGACGRIVNLTAPRPCQRFFQKIFLLPDIGEGRIKPSGSPSLPTGDTVLFVECLSGCCMAYRREVFDEFMFDENLAGYGYMEDIDFSYRVSRKYRLLYQPAALIEHYSSTHRRVESRSLRRMFMRHHRYLFKKNMPGGVRHACAFAVSVLGLLLYNLALERNVQAFLGVLDGLREPLRVEKNC